MNRPVINVTPLIDVLLVLLIIFMVVTPLKPRAFKTRVPTEQKAIGRENRYTLLVTVNMDGTLNLNTEARVGTASDPEPLIARLKGVFEQRVANGNVSVSFADDPGRPLGDRIERTVFIKAPKNLPYGSVARVVDAAKMAAAYPISLQIDNLN